ncbi:hypothetical protein FJT64_015780 [Amphibalanus amphitrite]|uniref:Uncharacterized protein n=1 Tax=Amphibalanus amphitrite TaxID=1232801 RepID=A0A6A4X1T0_AMPAM|nr:hypothetical protein FJT64_015780 [Amphibalanus amphitrite]
MERLGTVCRMAAVLLLAAAAAAESSVHTLAPMLDIEPLDVVHDSGALLNRSRRTTVLEDLSLAVPRGAILSLAPRFGWLLYQGEDEEEELDLVFESEFLYRFPEEEEEEEHHDRRQLGYHHSPYDALNREVAGETDFVLHSHRSKRMVHHRNKRMVRDKKMIYKGLENVFSIMGLDGRSCLLRAICEVTATPLVYDGVVGELLNMALVPRHTNGHHDDLKVYLEAEEHGLLGNDCSVTYSACPVSLFTMVAPGSVQFDS